ncbi:hypothetical protein OY671_004526 [Metschnikowia pulcherrima]|nr:hypothetical protein OY671_004526 [Metschnikowia pulcherrima]
MVLNKSKWDHKAKVQYLKKHNLARPKPTQKTTPKWSSKRTGDGQANTWLDESENSDWDSEDEAFLNHFYPQISEDRLSEESKRILKQQIIKIVKQREAGDAEENSEEAYDEHDGIYLGTKPETGDDEPGDSENDDFSDDEFQLEIPDLETKLSEFVVSDLSKSRNRKMLKNKVSENLLDEYGLDSYSSTVKDTDYNSSAQKTFRNVEKLTAHDLHGFCIGEGLIEPKQPSVRALSEAELEEHKARATKLQHKKFHDQIKEKFGSEPQKANVLEINNFNRDDLSQMASLNSKLTSATGISHKPVIVEDDLDELLGLEKESKETPSNAESSDFLSTTLPQKYGKKKNMQKNDSHKAKAEPDSFLDDLLGI